MKYVLWIVMFTALVGKGVCAQNYSNEVSFEYATTERGSTDSVTYDLYYTYYFTPVQASTGPLAYAELIERPSRIEIGYSFADYDANQSIADAESTLTGFVGHYYKDNYGFLASLIQQDGELESAQSSLKTDLESTYYTLGAIYYPEEHTRWTLAYIWGDMTVRYSPISIEDDSDLKRVFVELEKLVFLPANKYLAVSGQIAREEQKDVSGTEDGTELVLDVDYFFTRYSGVAIRYARFDGENSENQDTYRIGYQTYFNYQMSLGVFYQHDVGDLSSDSKEYFLVFTQRF